MSHLLRRPAAVPALFSPGVEPDAVASRPIAVRSPGAPAGPSPLFPALLLMSELPLIKGAVSLLSLSLPH